MNCCVVLYFRGESRYRDSCWHFGQGKLFIWLLLLAALIFIWGLSVSWCCVIFLWRRGRCRRNTCCCILALWRCMLWRCLDLFEWDWYLRMSIMRWGSYSWLGFHSEWRILIVVDLCMHQGRRPLVLLLETFSLLVFRPCILELQLLTFYWFAWFYSILFLMLFIWLSRCWGGLYRLCLGCQFRYSAMT